MKERLTISLSLELGASVHEVPGGNVRALSLSMTVYGVRGAIEFDVQDDRKKGGKYQDELLADFVKPDLAKLTLKIKAAYQDTGVPTERGELVTGGIVLERQVREHVYSRVLDTPSVLTRRYRVTFCDPAQAVWSQHFPCDLLTQKSFADAVNLHRGVVSVTFDWEAASKVVPLVFFHLDPARGASFYDLVVWYVQTRAGVFVFDPQSQTYAIRAVKSTEGSAVSLAMGDLAAMSSTFPEVHRHVPRVMCSYTEAATTTALTNSAAASTVFHDVLLRTPISQEVSDRAALEKSRPLIALREVGLVFAHFPREALLPNTLVNLPSGSTQSPLSEPSAFRVIEFELQARALEDEADVDYGDTSTAFELSIEARLEAKDERRVRLPPFSAPNFPGLIEGKVVSEVGETEELTYQIHPDQATSVDDYRVKVPLFANQIITAPYEPYTGSGALYLPLYKGQRVLVAFEFERARVHALLDWRGEARVPLAGQGQQLFLGKSPKSNTSVLHDYQSQKPVFRILRTNSNDTALLRLEEGKLTLKVEEKAGS